MTFLNILIIEDVLLTALDLRNTLEKHGHSVTAIARNRQQAIQAIDTQMPDLAIVDVMLEDSDKNGIEVSRELSEVFSIPIIFLTASSELPQFREAQSTRPAAYLLKPFKESELLFNIELAYHNHRPTRKEEILEGHLMLPTNGGLEMVDMEDVIFMEAGGSYSTVHMTDGTKHLISTNLGQLEAYFSRQNFFRLSRSIIINIVHIRRIKDGDVLIGDDMTKLPLPDAGKKELLKRLKVVRTKPNGKK